MSADRPPSKVVPWRVLRRAVTYADRWLTLRSDDCEAGPGRVLAPYHVIELPTWVCTVAITDDGRIVLAREYRHGTGEILAGLPGGTMDAGESDPEAAARRELLEETGHGGGRFVPLGNHPANPANQTNDLFSYLAVGVQPVADQELDPGEAIEVVTEDFVSWVDRVARNEERIQVSHAGAALLAAWTLLRTDGLAPAGLREQLRDAWLGRRSL